MIKRILIVLGIVIVVGLIVLWLIQGGASAVARVARTITNPVELFFGDGSSSGLLRLPWQPTDLTRGPDISQFADEADRQLAGTVPDGLQDQEGDRVSRLESFGTPSRYVGMIRLSYGAPDESGPAQEYIELNAGYTLTSPVPVSGWSLQSAVTGVRAYVPEGAATFVMGIVNTVSPITLSAGGTAVLTSGASPVGVSFQENVCSGYLGELRQFAPQISDECPAPKDSLPETADNLRAYGGSCFDYVASLSRCHFPGTQLPSNLVPACQSFIVNTYSYNGCVNAYRSQSSFRLPAWRIYLNRTSELWNNSHDVIRLLDAQGQTVDVLTY